MFEVLRSHDLPEYHNFLNWWTYIDWSLMILIRYWIFLTRLGIFSYWGWYITCTNLLSSFCWGSFPYGVSSTIRCFCLAKVSLLQLVCFVHFGGVIWVVWDSTTRTDCGECHLILNHKMDIFCGGYQAFSLEPQFPSGVVPLFVLYKFPNLYNFFTIFLAFLLPHVGDFSHFFRIIPIWLLMVLIIWEFILGTKDVDLCVWLQFSTIERALLNPIVSAKCSNWISPRHL